MPPKRSAAYKVPSAFDWRTTDQDEINRRRQRALDEVFVIANPTPAHRIFSNFQVRSASGLTYSVEIRDLGERRFACACIDFRINGLGTCKHVEAVLLHLQARFKRLFEAARKGGSNRVEITVDSVRDSIVASRNGGPLPRELTRWFGPDGTLRNGSPEAALEALRELSGSALPALRLSQEIDDWIAVRRQASERTRLRREYELKVQKGEWPAQETTVPLFPYQREGMLHLAFTERALLADEMGLGKTIQAIAACALLHRLGQASQVLVVTPASLKTEWEEQIRRFTSLDHQLVFGNKTARLQRYDRQSGVPFFTIVNYEQAVPDALDINQRLRPDVVVLDEAQRIKNWNTKTAQAVKRLRSRYAFVLTGTPIENRIDELHSLLDFLNPAVLGPLFRFNREFYDLDDRGRPQGLKNLSLLHERIKPFLLRRRKRDVESELPDRTDRNHFVRLSDRQRERYTEHEQQALRLLSAAARRPLTQQEQDKLQRELAMMRMICDSNFILDSQDHTSPKLAELEKLLEECLQNDSKVIVFSEWERMLVLVRGLCQARGIGFAWHTGSVPQLRRRAEITAFKNDPDCRVFLSTDSGATGLNLQNASVVINCDLPWNPAKLEQRIARAWRKHQTRPVLVLNLIAENTIEHRMLETLALKQSVAESVLDEPGRVDSIPIRGGRQAFLERLRQLVTPAGPTQTPSPNPARSSLPSDPAVAFAQLAREQLDGALVACEERYPREGAHTVLLVVVESDPAGHRAKLAAIHEEWFGPGRRDSLAPVHLEVIDRATSEALDRLAAAGLIATTTRAARDLSVRTSAEAPPLSPEEQARVKALRERASRQLKVARVLAEGGLLEESRPAFLEAILDHSRSLAIGSRLPEPGTLEEALRPPQALLWPSLDGVRAFVSDPAADWRKLATHLQSFIA